MQQVAVVPEEAPIAQEIVPTEPTVHAVEEIAMVEVQVEEEKKEEVEEVKVEDTAPPNAPVNNSGNLLQPDSESE